MGKTTGFLEYSREEQTYLPPKVRIKNFNEFVKPLTAKALTKQAARCMDCGTPFCHIGCPLGNIIPDFNHYLYTGNTLRAYEILRATNNFPSITGRVCPAPCESSCVLAINKPAVAIKNIEYALGDVARENKWDAASPPGLEARTGKKVAIVGSGPAGLAAADQLNQAGHSVKVFEKSDRIGGLLMYGIPNFKLNKKLVEHEIARLSNEGVAFQVGTTIGRDLSLASLRKEYDAVILAIGASIPRDLKIENRSAGNILFAMDFLTDATKSILDNRYNRKYSAAGKNVLVIGGGDTGSDCIGTSFRQQAKRVTQIELLPKPPATRDETMPWPHYDHIFRVSSSQAEGAKRVFSILTKKFVATKEHTVQGIHYKPIVWDHKKKNFTEQPGTARTIQADLVLLAMGFTGSDLAVLECNTTKKLAVTRQGTIATEQNHPYRTNLSNVFVAGDARRGQSLVVWAISEGRECARAVDSFLCAKPSALAAKSSASSRMAPLNANSVHENYEIR
ncbi:glutamate synthase (NADPH/NADH) small chain [Spirochaetota bacterium]|nr:glutamate synthase (NADPH/NADH) small chain [Spirochaetota bacterium]